MNNIKKRVIVCAVALVQFLLNPSVIAANEDYSNTNEARFSEAELAQILAPIALYPDSLLSHIVIASTYPLEIVEAYRWRQQNSDLEASEAVERAENQGWDPSIAALVAFPSVLERLNEDLKWTQNLGDAFLEDEGLVLDTIQALRQQAENANTFVNMQNMSVTKVNKQIVIQTVQKEIVYVPYYDTRVVYGKWHWNLYPPVYWDHRPYFSVHFPGRISGLFHWNRGINISFNYHFSAFKWHSRHLVVTHHHQTKNFRSYNRIATSYGAKRWQHKPTHRRGVAYRSSELSSRYNSRKDSKLYAKHSRQAQHNDAKSRVKSTSAIHIKLSSKNNKEAAFTRKLKTHNQYTALQSKNNGYATSSNTNKSAKSWKQPEQSLRKEGSKGLDKHREIFSDQQTNKSTKFKENKQLSERSNHQVQVKSRNEATNYRQNSQGKKLSSPKQSRNAKLSKQKH